MPKQEAPLHTLQSFLPRGSYELVLRYLNEYKVHLTVTRGRKSILGDYRHAIPGKNHRITVNGNLNEYAFLITLLHELAHLIAFIQYGNRIASHGKEWKIIYGQILREFLHLEILPGDISREIQKTIHSPGASSCAEDGLIRILRKYDKNEKGLKLVEEIEPGKLFSIGEGKIFRKEEKIRKRFKCVEVSTGKVYLFSPVYEVQELRMGAGPE